MKPRNTKKTIANGEELQEKRLVTFYQDELNHILELSKEQATKQAEKEHNQGYFKFYYEYYLVNNALNYGAYVGFNAGKRQAKNK